MARPGTELLIELVQSKHDCLVQLRTAGLRQLELVQSGGMEELMTVLSAKQRLLDRLSKIERQLDPFRNDDPNTRRWPNADDRRRCAARVRECEQLLRALVDQERQSEATLVRRRDEAQHKLEGTHTASAVHRAYANQDAPGATPSRRTPVPPAADRAEPARGGHDVSYKSQLET